MRNFAAYLLLLYPLILFACPQGGQRNLVNHNTILLDSTATDNRLNLKKLYLLILLKWLFLHPYLMPIKYTFQYIKTEKAL